MIDIFEKVIDIIQFAFVMLDKVEKLIDISGMCCDKSLKVIDKTEMMGDKNAGRFAAQLFRWVRNWVAANYGGKPPQIN